MKNENKERAFEGIWIPKHIWLDHDLSPIEKLFIAEINSLDNDPEKGCYASNEYFGKFFRISEGTAANIISSLRKRGYVVQVFFDGRNRGIRVHENVKAGFMLNGDRVHENVKADFTKKGKPVSRKREHISTSNKQGNNKEKEVPAAVAPDAGGPTVLVIETVEVEDGKNGTTSRGAGPQTKSWTRAAAEAFDEVAAEKCAANRIDYQPFNWSVCQDENFRQLRMLREKAITPDFKQKHKTEPTEEQIIVSFRAVFRLAWDYFYRIQKDTGGAMHYTPTSVYKSYNNIKTTVKNGNINGSTGVIGSDGKTYQFGQGINDTGAFDPRRGY